MGLVCAWLPIVAPRAAIAPNPPCRLVVGGARIVLSLALEAGMDPITLIVAVGAASRLRESASATVKDAYEGLKGLVRNRFTGRHDGQLVLARHAEAPKVWEGRLVAELAAVGAPIATPIWWQLHRP